MDQETNQEFDNLIHIIQDSFESLEGKMATKQDIKEMATKQDIKDMATKQDLKEMEEKMNKRFDSIEVRLATIQNDLDDVRRQLNELQKNTFADTDAFAQDILELRKRLDRAETEIAKLKLQPSALSA